MKIDMRWPDALVARLDERAAATGSNRSELVRRYAEAGLRSDADDAPSLMDPPAPAACGHEPELKRLKADLAQARRDVEGLRRRFYGVADERAVAEATGQDTCGFGQHGKVTKVGNCEKCGAYVGRS